MTEGFSELPDDVEAYRSEALALKSQVADLQETNAAAKAEIARLTSILRTLQRGRFGKSSEKLSPDEAAQLNFAFEEVETALASLEARLAAKSGDKASGDEAVDKPAAAPQKPRFPAHLERVEEIVEPAIPPGFEDKDRVRIGQDESVRLDVVRARFRLVVTIRPKYLYKEPETIVQAPAPEHIVEAGLPTGALLAQIAVSKYADGLPLYRQEAIYAPRRRRTGPLVDGAWARSGSTSSRSPLMSFSASATANVSSPTRRRCRP